MITLGSDPEFMIRDAEGELRSAIGIVPGTKDNRFSLGDGHAMYYDNVLAECNIRPGSSKEECVASFRECFERFARKIAPNQLCVQASAEYPEGECLHRDAKVFGCDPEFCAYDMIVREPPSCTTTFRSAGGHIHIGYDGGKQLPFDDPERKQEIEEANMTIAWNRVWVVRMADLMIGIPSLFLDKDRTSYDRRKLYGGAGTHRACKGWGVEYRTLGNFWLARPELVELIYDLADTCVQMVIEDGIHHDVWDEDGEGEVDSRDLRNTIDNWNMERAEDYLQLVQKYTSKPVWDRFCEEREREYSDDFYKHWEIKL